MHKRSFSAAATAQAIRRAFRRLSPRGMFLRFFLMLALPMLATQAVAVYVFYYRHWSSVSKHMLRGVEGDVLLLVELAERRPERAEESVREASRLLYLSAAIKSPGDPALRPKAPADKKNEAAQELERIVSAALRRPFLLSGGADGDAYRLSVGTKGGALVVDIPQKRLENPSTYIFVLWMTGTGLLLVAAAALFMRNQVRSVARLAEAMGHVGRGEAAVRFSPGGAREVRAAGEAFVAMKRRIERFVRGRTDMLTGISHDLKTPITRIKLRLALMPEGAETESVDADLNEMTSMIDAYLDYLREEAGEGGRRERTDVKALLEEVVRRCAEEGGAAVRLEAEEGMPHVTTDAAGLKRALTNCVRNAVLYGGGAVRVKAERAGAFLRIGVEDNGDGVPEHLREQIFRPFFRIGGKENGAAGSGLGLAIAKDVVERAGGSVTMERSAALGGAKCVVRLPLG
jgi:two-component system osmolarity sensor histidine kinase EnvZ